jgi:hypothetical protein
VVDLQGLREKKEMTTAVAIGVHPDHHVLDITTGIWPMQGKAFEPPKNTGLEPKRKRRMGISSRDLSWRHLQRDWI